MIDVKIREITENIVNSGPMGIQLNQPHKYLQLYFSESGNVVPDKTYTLKQGEQEQICHMIAGQLIGAEWVAHNQEIYLI